MTAEEIENTYTYHAPNQEQQEKYARMRNLAKLLVKNIEADCPTSREKSLAMTNLEQAVMWANAAIARRT
jgi:hypothetical protein